MRAALRQFFMRFFKIELSNEVREQRIDVLSQASLREEFAANVSHELKTPLTAISGYAELIESGFTKEEDTRRFAGEIRVNAERLLSLINDIIELSELDDGYSEIEMEQVNLYKKAADCVSMMKLQAEKQGVSVFLEGEADCMVLANQNLIEELLHNLCSNAIRYNEKGGKVTISTHYTEDKRVVLTVADTGIGIPQKYQQRVFERFYRVDPSRSKKSGGTGLGLAIVKHIVARHNARISLESEEGRGTTIRIVF
ncbi:hypothetical protein FACS1894111_07240 [Clostridia bacterium]|nr:hypothetical protein FACS1894111_07240 [Clostridia bacterium]